jgi:hypothetical protein
MAVAAFSGVTAFDAESGTAGVAGSTIQPGSITPAVANELYVTGVTVETVVAAPTVGSPFVVLNSNQGASSNNLAGGLAYKIKTDSSAENPTWTYVGGLPAAATMAAFKP